MTIAIATEMVQVVAPADLQAGKFARGQTTKRGETASPSQYCAHWVLIMCCIYVNVGFSFLVNYDGVTFPVTVVSIKMTKPCKSAAFCLMSFDFAIIA
jgi:hypothetical protein